MSVAAPLVARAKRLVPDRYRPAIRWRASVLRQYAQRGTLSGPFTGVRLRTADNPDNLVMQLGTYEMELHPLVREIIERRPQTVINIGSRDGYYAIGLAQQLPTARIIAYELEPERQQETIDNAARNSVADRIEMRGAASALALEEDIRQAVGAPVVLCDIDGPEIVVIDPAVAPSLARAVLLIEVHGPDICRVMEQRFSRTHTLRWIQQRKPSMADVPDRPWYLRWSDPVHEVHERNSDEIWLWAVPQLSEHD